MKKLFLFLLPIIIYANNIDVAFSPKQGSLDLVLKTINSAQKTICMATYSFTSKPVALALLDAKRRGVLINIVSDFEANNDHYSSLCHF